MSARHTLDLPSWLARGSDLADQLGREPLSAIHSQLEQNQKHGRVLPEWLNDPTAPSWLMTFVRTVRCDPVFREHQWLLDLWVKEGFITEPDPAWALEMTQKFQAKIAHQFILHFNVTDYVYDARCGYDHRLPDYLVWRYPEETANRSVVFYNRSQGVKPAAERLLGAESRESNSRWQAFVQNLQRWGLRADNRLRLLMNPAEALYALEQALYEADDPTYADQPNNVVIFEFAEKVAPAGSIEFYGSSADLLIQIETLQRWALDERIRGKGHLILLLARNLAEVADDLRQTNSGIEAIEVPMPDDRARLKYISFLFYNYLRSDHPAGSREICFDEQGYKEDQLRAFARRTAGLTRVAIQDIVLRAFQAGTPITDRLVQERKESVIRSESRNLLEVVKTNYTMDAAGGLERIKRFLREEVVRPLRNGSRNTPAGVLFLGPPGTGKTLIAEGLAAESGVNFVKLGNFRDQFVGQSERNLARALSIIRAMTPVIVFMDELDQSEGRRSEVNLDSGVSSRVFAKLLEVMSDSSLRGKVVWIAASNRPDLIDDAMRRPGRFDDKIPFLMPTVEERRSIFEAILRYKIGLAPEHIERLHLNWLAENSAGFSGAEIEVVVSRAVRAAAVENTPLTTDHLRDALTCFVHSVNQAKYRLMTLLALAEVNNIKLLPQPGENPDLDARWFDENGQPRSEVIQAEIHQLRSTML